MNLTNKRLYLKKITKECDKALMSKEQDLNKAILLAMATRENQIAEQLMEDNPQMTEEEAKKQAKEQLQQMLKEIMKR